MRFHLQRSLWNGIAVQVLFYAGILFVVHRVGTDANAVGTVFSILAPRRLVGHGGEISWNGCQANLMLASIVLSIAAFSILVPTSSRTIVFCFAFVKLLLKLWRWEMKPYYELQAEMEAIHH